MPTLSSRFDAAFAYAHQTHATHTRKGSDVPYLGHLMGVASIVIDDGGTEDEAIARGNDSTRARTMWSPTTSRWCARTARPPAAAWSTSSIASCALSRGRWATRRGQRAVQVLEHALAVSDLPGTQPPGVRAVQPGRMAFEKDLFGERTLLTS